MKQASILPKNWDLANTPKFAFLLPLASTTSLILSL